MSFARALGARRPTQLSMVATLCIAACCVGTGAGPAVAAEKITYLLPAPPSLPAFAPWVLAKHLGYYAEAGYDVDFVVARGGVDVAKQIGVGNAPIGGAIGDTPIIVRGNGVPVKSVGLMGGGALTVVVGRKDRGIEKLEDLRGKKISVLAFQDTTYYALLGALASKNITKNDVNAQAVGPAAVASLVVAGTVDACACTPDWEIDVKEGVKDTVSLPTTDYFQSMSQAILASDKMIAERPDMVRGIVKATLKGMQFVMNDPAEGRARLCRGLAVLQGQGRADEEDPRELHRAHLQGAEHARRHGSATAEQPAALLQAAGLHRGRAAGRPALQQRLHQVAEAVGSVAPAKPIRHGIVHAEEQWVRHSPP